MNVRNPFWVIGASPDATPGEIEREGRKLLGLLEVGSSAATKYTCALGTFERDATMVREAMATLRDPKERAKEQCLAKLLATTGEEGPDEEFDEPLTDAFAAFDYRGL